MLSGTQKLFEKASSRVNVIAGVASSIAELASTIGEVTGFEGTIEYDTSKPDGAPRKLMDNIDTARR